MTWSFEERLAFEHSQREFLDALWRAWFGPEVSIRPVTDLGEQRRGLDVRLAPAWPAREPMWLTAQEKVRSRDWGDVLLERVSNDRTGTPGWTLTCEADLVLYAVAPSRRGILLPGPGLRRVAQERFPAWVKAYGEKRADNGEYHTINVALPESVLRREIDAGHGPYRCSRCDRPSVWSETRGGSAVAGCVGCTEGMPPWELRAGAGSPCEPGRPL